MVDRIVPYPLSWRATFGYSLPFAVAISGSLRLVVGIFGCSLPLVFDSFPLAVAIFLPIWHFYLRQIAIFVQEVDFVRPFHRQKPQSEKMQHQFSAVSGAATKNYSHPHPRWLAFYFWPRFWKVASKIKPPGLSTVKSQSRKALLCLCLVINYHHRRLLHLQLRV